MTLSPKGTFKQLSTQFQHWNIIFNISKTYQKEIWKHPQFFAFQNHIKYAQLHQKKNTSKQRWFFVHQNQVEKSTSKRRWYFAHRNYIEKNYVETTSIFHPSKLHRKSTSKWRGNLSMYSFQRINIISTSNRCWVVTLTKGWLRWLKNLSFTD